MHVWCYSPPMATAFPTRAASSQSANALLHPWRRPPLHKWRHPTSRRRPSTFWRHTSSLALPSSSSAPPSAEAIARSYFSKFRRSGGYSKLWTAPILHQSNVLGWCGMQIWSAPTSFVGECCSYFLLGLDVCFETFFLLLMLHWFLQMRFYVHMYCCKHINLWTRNKCASYASNVDICDINARNWK